MKVDFYTIIHKALRRCLFNLSTQIGSSDYRKLSICKHNHEDLLQVLTLLKLHAAHEDEFIHPLIIKKLNYQADKLNHEHQMQESELIGLEKNSAAIINLVDETERVHQGLLLYRKLNRFIANYLHHIEEEEALMPILQEISTEHDLMQALEALVLSFTQDEILNSITYMLPALHLQERTDMMLALLTNAEEYVVDQMLKRAEIALPDLEWTDLKNNVFRSPQTLV